jgi:hypothetical protein
MAEAVGTCQDSSAALRPLTPTPFSHSNQENTMKLRSNEFCPIHRSLSCCGREPVQKTRRAKQFGVQRIDDPNHPRGYRELRSNREMRRLMNRKILSREGSAGSARRRSLTIRTSFQIISIPKAWEERGETIILTISRLRIGGAMERRGQAEYRLRCMGHGTWQITFWCKKLLTDL